MKIIPLTMLLLIAGCGFSLAGPAPANDNSANSPAKSQEPAYSDGQAKQPEASTTPPAAQPPIKITIDSSGPSKKPAPKPAASPRKKAALAPQDDPSEWFLSSYRPVTPSEYVPFYYNRMELLDNGNVKAWTLGCIYGHGIPEKNAELMHMPMPIPCMETLLECNCQESKCRSLAVILYDYHSMPVKTAPAISEFFPVLPDAAIWDLLPIMEKFKQDKLNQSRAPHAQ